MTREVPAGARELASRLAALFESDCQIAERLNDAQRRLRHANDQLWSGLHPDAFGLVYDDADRVAIAQGTSVVAGRMIDALGTGDGERQLETVVLAALQRAHWTIHRAFVDYQTASEERRQLAVDAGEVAQQLADALSAVGWPADMARRANVHELAAAGAVVGWEEGR